MSKSPEEGPESWSLTTLKNTFNYIKDSAPVKIVTGSAVGRTIGVVTVLASATVAAVPATIVVPVGPATAFVIDELPFVKSPSANMAIV